MLGDEYLTADDIADYYRARRLRRAEINEAACADGHCGAEDCPTCHPENVPDDNDQF